MKTRRQRWMTLLAAAYAGCGAQPGDGAVGSAVAAIEAVPSSVRCVRLTLRGGTRSFDVTGGGSASLALGPQAPGTMSVTGAAYDVACAEIVGATVASWVSEPASVVITAGLTADFVLTMRPNASVSGRVDFVLPARGVAAGGNSSYAVMADGTVRAWGENGLGQLGDGTTTSRRAPVATDLAAGAVRVVASERHACALMSGGQVLCWGANASGQLGDGTTVSHRTPAPIAAGSPPFASLSAGRSHMCGVTAESPPRALCWGGNESGQLGDGTFVNRLVPTAALLVNPLSAHAGVASTCAVIDTAQVACWGDNFVGLFGTGVTGADPDALPSLTLHHSARSFALGSNFSCAATFAGDVSCAGRNDRGQLGEGTALHHPAPGVVVGLSDVVEVVAGAEHACARRRDGSVWCWGSGGAGQIGSGVALDASTPQRVVGLTGATVLAAGFSHVCALRSDGTVWCWGRNYAGAIGDGTIGNALVPVRVQL